MTPSGTRNSGAVHFIANLAKFSDLLCRKGASLGDVVKLERKGNSPSSVGQKMKPSPIHGMYLYVFKGEYIFAQVGKSPCAQSERNAYLR